MEKKINQYQVLARRYRPQTFSEVIGQDSIVTTLKNAIKHKRLAHAYLFCGSRGTGKTTLARIFAKALNCTQKSETGEPCNKCTSCKEITSGNSLDVLEIDGASHRGIDDVREINDTIGYATASGGYKIYIIDEVHMLTKEAFNALLKTLEEPPEKAMFFFATTEPHKILPTILSRCQRFNLSRIPLDKITRKLQEICSDLKVIVQEDALRLIAQRAEGGLRDAESLLDQILAFHEGEISQESVASILGIMSQEALFTLDQAGKEGNLAMAFELAHQVFSQGKDIIQFVETLTEHFRSILMIKLGEKGASFINLSDQLRSKYESTAALYSKEQVLTILEDLIEAQNQIRFMPSSRIGLEAILLKILRSHQRIPIEYLVRRLAELEQSSNTVTTSPTTLSKPTASTTPSLPAPVAPPTLKSPSSQTPSIDVDPTPTAEDVGKKNKSAASPASKKEPPPTPPPAPAMSAPPTMAPKLSQQDQNRLNTVLQFAAVELEGTIQRKF